MWSSGKVKRRGPLGGLTALLFLLPMVLAACGGTSATKAPQATASGTTSATASVGGDPRGAAPAKRGGGGTLHLLYWQAPTILNFHLAHGTKDYDASRVVEEPLATLSINAATPDIPVLAKEIPST